MRTAIFSTFPPRACGIGTFSSDLRTALLDVADVEDVRPIVVVDEPSSPQRDEVLATVSQSVRGDYARAARLLSHMDVDVVLLQHEFGIFGGADGDYVAVVRAGRGAAARRHPPHAPVGAERAPARGADGALRPRRARDRDDGHGAAACWSSSAPATRRRFASCPHGAPDGPRPPTRRAGGRLRSALRRADARRLRPPAAPVPALDLRAPVRRQGHRDDARRDAGDRRATSRGAVPDRRAHASPGARREGEAYRAAARAQGGGARPRGPRRLRRSVRLHRRARRPARGHRRVRDAVPQQGADRVRRADVRDRGRLRRGLDAVLVRRGHAVLRRRPARAVRRPRRARDHRVRLLVEPRGARRRRAPRRVASAASWPGRPSARPPPTSSPRPPRWRSPGRGRPRSTCT